eukprot:CAMPEP_0114247466 /NCGR_PEP_ID=MMETSP0058-20121206/13038_1 /TAXON_ID=36894 /ORGANISM="Pyramimonas parkeae, CCMP726" /LENGTH=141 /DNA_ID=CAMNT_0001360775 /DNA_START=178 /DNA_END=603 /DNA_ORIENTATION=+
MVATLSASTVFGSKLQTVRLKTNNTPRVNRVACAMSDSRPLRTALAATLVVPAVLLTAQVAIADPVKDLVNTQNKILTTVTKPGICDRKACKIYPQPDGSFLCRLYRPQGTEYTFEGQTEISKAGKFQRVDCDSILQEQGL